MSDNASISVSAPPGLRLYPDDTVLSALRVMQRHGASCLPVVDEARGVYLGEVSEEELYRLWAGAPLARLREVLRARMRLGGAPSPWRTPQGGWVH